MHQKNIFCSRKMGKAGDGSAVDLPLDNNIKRRINDRMCIPFCRNFPLYVN